MAALNEETGGMTFVPAELAPIAVSLLVHIPLAQGRVFDRAFQRPSLDTAKKQGASSSGIDMDKVWRACRKKK